MSRTTHAKIIPFPQHGRTTERSTTDVKLYSAGYVFTADAYCFMPDVYMINVTLCCHPSAGKHDPGHTHKKWTDLLYQLNTPACLSVNVIMNVLEAQRRIFRVDFHFKCTLFSYSEKK